MCRRRAARVALGAQWSCFSPPSLSCASSWSPPSWPWWSHGCRHPCERGERARAGRAWPVAAGVRRERGDARESGGAPKQQARPRSRGKRSRTTLSSPAQCRCAGASGRHAARGSLRRGGAGGGGRRWKQQFAMQRARTHARAGAGRGSKQNTNATHFRESQRHQQSRASARLRRVGAERDAFFSGHTGAGSWQGGKAKKMKKFQKKKFCSSCALRARKHCCPRAA